MTDAPAPTQQDDNQPTRAAQPAPDLLDELLWLARDAQERLPLDSLGDRGYTLGQRNTYARAAGIVAARDSNEDPVLIADRIVHTLADGATDLTAIRDTALAGIPRPTTEPTLEWVGRKAFDSRYGDVPGIDQDYGMRWGPAHNQRISFRRTPGASDGMLYAHDPVWDEYALIHRHVPTRVITDVFLQALRQDEHLPLEDFAHLVTTHLHPATPEPTILAVEP